MHTRAVLVHQLFRKVLCLSPAEWNHFSSGASPGYCTAHMLLQVFTLALTAGIPSACPCASCVCMLSPYATAAVGRVFNLVTSDVETLQLLSQSIMNIISSPLRIIVAMFMLYAQLGLASLVALASLILMMPVQVRVLSPLLLISAMQAS